MKEKLSKENSKKLKEQAIKQKLREHFEKAGLNLNIQVVGKEW